MCRQNINMKSTTTFSINTTLVYYSYFVTHEQKQIIAFENAKGVKTFFGNHRMKELLGQSRT